MYIYSKSACFAINTDQLTFIDVNVEENPNGDPNPAICFHVRDRSSAIKYYPKPNHCKSLFEKIMDSLEYYRKESNVIILEKLEGISWLI